jgi:hypothetical protein
MHDGFAALLRQPTARRYKQLRSSLLASGSHANCTLRFIEAEHCLHGGDFEALSALVAQLLPEGLLSLRLHRLGAIAALQREDTERAQLHRFTFDALCEAVESTGHGTRTRPWVVTHAFDAVELLAARGRKVVSQSLIEDDGRQFEVLLCDDEHEFWFEVTDLLPLAAVPAKRRKRPAAAARTGPSPRNKAVSRSRH